MDNNDNKLIIPKSGNEIQPTIEPSEWLEDAVYINPDTVALDRPSNFGIAF